MDIFYTILALLLLFGIAYANGSNDISKTIATLAGAGVTSVKHAILWGCFWMVMGGLSGVYWGVEIIKNLTENIYLTSGILPIEMAVSIAIAPMIWVLLSTFKKWPVSTTHAIVGSLIGAGVIALGSDFIAWEKVGKKIVLPLLISPFISITLAIVLSPLLKSSLKQTKKYQICFSPLPRLSLVSQGSNSVAVITKEEQDCTLCSTETNIPAGTSTLRLSEDSLHWVSSGMLSFARGLNDTPKLIAVILPLILVTNNTLHDEFFILAAMAMGLGGFISGQYITEILGFKITALTHQQGFIANLVSAFLVIGSSKMGLPVSTTHVSASAIMGTGLAEKNKLQKETIISMLLAWIITVPASAAIAIFCYLLLHTAL